MHIYIHASTRKIESEYRVPPAFRPHRPFHHHGQVGQAGVQERVILVVVLEGGKDVVEEATGEGCGLHAGVLVGRWCEEGSVSGLWIYHRYIYKYI